MPVFEVDRIYQTQKEIMEYQKIDRKSMTYVGHLLWDSSLLGIDWNSIRMGSLINRIASEEEAMEDGLELEYDIVVRIPPKRKYMVQVRSIIVKKGVLRPVVPEGIL